MAGTALRIENSSRAHAESLGSALGRYQTELVSLDGRWQLEIDLGDPGSALLELFDAIASWLEESRVDSLLLHFDARSFTLLRPARDRTSDSAAFLLERVAQLETALESRIVIEQAKGIVAHACGVDVSGAFELIRRAARSQRIELHTIAGAIVASPGEAAALVRRSVRDNGGQAR